MTPTTSETFFDSIYRNDRDPWNFSTSEYELGRYQRILAALGDGRWRLAYEPGCSIGVLTEQLAKHCDSVVGCDISQTAVEFAHKRCSSLSNVTIRHATLAEFVPYRADLYIFCEVGYYLTRQDLQVVLESHISALAENAMVVACHWLGHSTDHLLHGDEVHEILDHVRGLTHDYAERHPEFRLDRWMKHEVKP